jgi:hypothetical protein
MPGLEYVSVITSGDIDHDGDLDLFVAQYRPPYENGSMPTPYYDANDGLPAFLFLNDGHGNFIDRTSAAGLSKKRFRRSYSGSFVDLDGDGNLDLVVISDFAGLDVYRNDGTGHFLDMNRIWAPESHAFGMAHTISDFNSDGKVDLLMVGMTSPTVNRLEHLNLWRGGVQEDKSLRSRMVVGNRLYLGTSDGLSQPGFGASIERSGWSWGCNSFDVDNDGFPDVYVANGFGSRNSVREFEPEFWLHDVFIGSSPDNAASGRIKLTRLGSVWEASN